jgi:hypothetical protein
MPATVPMHETRSGLTSVAGDDWRLCPSRVYLPRAAAGRALDEVVVPLGGGPHHEIVVSAKGLGGCPSSDVGVFQPRMAYRACQLVWSAAIELNPQVFGQAGEAYPGAAPAGRSMVTRRCYPLGWKRGGREGVIAGDAFDRMSEGAMVYRDIVEILLCKRNAQSGCELQFFIFPARIGECGRGDMPSKRRVRGIGSRWPQGKYCEPATFAGPSPEEIRQSGSHGPIIGGGCRR